MKPTAIRVSVLACALSLLAGCSHEQADWQKATTANTTDAYGQFVNQHPKSQHVADAQARIALLQEARDWQAATAADTRGAYEQYLAQHADGPNAQEARIRIENFAQAAAPAAVAGNAIPPTAKPASKPKTVKPLSPSTPSMATGGGAHEAAMAAMNKTEVGATSTGAHYVQLGAFSSRAHAEAHWKHLSTRFAHELGALTPRYVAGTSHSAAVVRLQVAVNTRAQGKALCEKLHAHAQPCVTVGAG